MYVFIWLNCCVLLLLLIYYLLVEYLQIDIQRNKQTIHSDLKLSVFQLERSLSLSLSVYVCVCVCACVCSR